MNRYALYARKSQEDEGRQQQSIDDQIQVMTDLAQRLGLELALTLSEEKSAKEPYQRPVFDALIERVNKGEIEGILCYHVNRLARNMVEGGLLQHLLTKGQLKEIRTHSEVFRSGDNILPFILQAAMSTQYSLDLSVHVKRGIASKVEKGGYPQRAPEGYVNNLFEHTIEADPERFPLIRKAWELMLTGTYSLDALAEIMNSQWGYTTRKARKVGGKGIHKSGLHRLFHNIFYTGYFLHKGDLHQGTHPPMITFEEFDRVQKILGRSGTTRPRTREFAYTGMVVCARCGRQVTAEHKKGRHGRGDYTYYHCSNYRNCGSRAVRQEVIEEEIERYLQSVKVDPSFRPLALEVIERMFVEESEKEHAQFEQQNRALEEAERQMSRLIQMKLKEMLTDEEFEREKRRLQKEIIELQKAAQQSQLLLEYAREGTREVVHFVTSAPYEFEHGTIQKKREIAKKLGVVYRLRDGVLEMELHPLLAPLYNRAIEPQKSGSGSTRKGDSSSPVSLGWAEEISAEALSQVFYQLLEGVSRIPVIMPERSNPKLRAA